VFSPSFYLFVSTFSQYSEFRLAGQAWFWQHICVCLPVTTTRCVLGLWLEETFLSYGRKLELYFIKSSEVLTRGDLPEGG
jgi:hypothetical protein